MKTQMSTFLEICVKPFFACEVVAGVLFLLTQHACEVTAGAFLMKDVFFCL